MIRGNFQEGGTLGRTGRLVAVGVVVLALVLGGGYLLLSARNSDSPPPAALDPEPSTTAGGDTATSQPDGAATADGTWRVSDDGSSYVGYRVREQLAFLSSPNDAVGRSNAVTGTMRVLGDQVESVRIQADLTKLTSDESRRDNAIRQRGLESEQFPTAAFELTEPIQLDGPPVSGQEVGGTGRGRLTVHGVTRDVDLDLKGRWTGSAIEVAGQLPVKMSDYNIQAPRFGPVVSIEDSLAVEFRLAFARLAAPPASRAPPMSRSRSG
jgi:polyisoprenoid-binding protein YceI